MRHSLHRSIVLLSSLIAVGPHAALAQSLIDTSSVIPSLRPVAVWVSAGLGPSSNGLAGAITTTVSAGSLVVAYRGGFSGNPFPGTSNDVHSNAVLFGARTDGRRLFGSAALGYGRATAQHYSDNGNPIEYPTVGVLAYDCAVHANYIVPGIAASFSGIIGTSHTTSLAVTVELELGWFGK